MEILSFIGIVLALVVIILGSLRGYSLILLSTVAALIVACTGNIGMFDAYAATYMGGVANMVLVLFPIFLGGQMFGKMLEFSGLPMSVANAVFRKLGPSSAVAAVYIATLLMSIGGINVFVIIFTMYPLAAAFFQRAGISRCLIRKATSTCSSAPSSRQRWPRSSILSWPTWGSFDGRPG